MWYPFTNIRVAFGHSKGISLLEILVVIGILSFLFTVGVPFGTNLFSTQQHNESVGIVADAFSKAQQNALSSVNDSAWTLRLTNQSVSLSSGSTYNAINATTWNLSDRSQLSIPGVQDITFQKHTAESNVGSFSVITDSQTTSFELYASGALSIQ